MNAIPSSVTKPLWTLGELAEATCGEASGDPLIALEGVSIDTRTLQPGDLFIAIVGPYANGHDYVGKAFDRGAAACVVAEPGSWSGPVLKVADTFVALQAIARAARQRSTAGIIAVTGSVGKTSTKEMLGHVLSAQPTATGGVSVTQGNLNNHWGLPLSLARMPADASYGVLEMGMNHAGEIEPLSIMARPEVALITAVEAVHLEFFESVEGIARAKAEIMAGLQPGGAVVLPRDNPYFDLLNRLAVERGIDRIIGFGRHAGADVRLLDVEMTDAGSKVEADLMGRRISYNIGVPGEHMAINSLAVLAAVSLIGADTDVAADALAGAEAVSGRGERHVIACADGDAILIDDAYNASPSSMCAAMQTAALVNPDSDGRRIAVLGDMLELGDESLRAHADLLGAITETGISRVFAVGPLMQSLWSTLPEALRGAYELDPDILARRVADDLRGGDVVLVKGSKGSLVSRVVDHIVSAKEA